MPDTPQPFQPLVNSGSPAAQIWSFGHLRNHILSYLPNQALIKVLQLSKENFVGAVGMLYDSMKYEQFKKLEEKCIDLARLRYYTKLIRHMDTSGSNKISINASLFNRFPFLVSAEDIHNMSFYLRYNQSEDPFTTSVYMISNEIYNVGLDEIADDYMDDLVEHENLPKEWDIIRNIKEVEIYTEYNAPEFDGLLDRLFTLWTEKDGIFELPINSLKLDFPITCQRLLEESTKMIEQGTPSPKSISVPIHDESGGESKIIPLIENLSELVEEIDFTSWEKTRLGSEPSIQTTKLQDFFLGVKKRPFQWPTGDKRKLRRLSILLKHDQIFSEGKWISPSLTIPDSNDDDQLINLSLFRITSDINGFPDSQKNESKIIWSLPDLPQIATWMLSIGGTACVYDLCVLGSNADDLISIDLTAILREEMLDIWDPDQREIGWKRLPRDSEISKY